ncbi:MAG: hypothetical protein ACFFDT_33120, partial [Candidatus Hodarchaeota archaeon]
NHFKKYMDRKVINLLGGIVSIFSIMGLSGVLDIIRGDLHFRSINQSITVLITISIIPGLIILSFSIFWLVGFTGSFKDLLEKIFEIDPTRDLLKSKMNGGNQDQSGSILNIKEILELYLRHSIQNIRQSTSAVTQTYLRFSGMVFLVGLVLSTWTTFVMNLPPIYAIGTIAIVGIACIIAFIYPQYNFRRVIVEEKRLLLNIIEKKYHEILINYLTELNNRDTLWKELSGLSDLSNRIESILEWPFNYTTFFTVLAGAFGAFGFPVISILIGVLGLL